MTENPEPAGPARPGSRRTLIVAGAAVVVTAAVAIYGWGGMGGSSSAPPRPPFEITPANVAPPPLSLPLADGGRVTLADATGQVLFVNFWATWCPPCRDEMPSMLRLGRELAERHPGRFRMVAVSVDEGWDVVKDYFGGVLPPGATVALDADQEVTRAWYCAARGGCPDSFKFPETYVVDRTGRLVAYMVGPRDWSDPAARQFLEKLIGG